MKKTILCLLFILSHSVLFGQSNNYESVGQCVLQIMKERKLSGNKIYESIQGECERIINLDKSSDSNHIIRTKNKTIFVSEDKWDFLPSDSNYSKNYQSTSTPEGHLFKPIITVFLIRMTDDRKRERIVKNEYFESFVLHPNSITVQMRKDKGDYWVMSRETYKLEQSFKRDTSFNFKELMNSIPEIDNQIDRVRFILNSEF